MGAEYNPIVSGLQSGLQLRQQREQQKIEQERVQNERDYHDKLIEDSQQKLKQAQDQFDATHKLAESAHQVQLLGLKQGMQESLLKTGQAPGFSKLSDNPDGTVSYGAAGDHPLFPGSQITLPSPAMYAKNQADLERITLAPKTEQKISETDAAEAAKASKQLEVDSAKLAAEHKNKLAETAAHDSVLMQIRKDQDDANLNRTKITAGATLGAASLHSQATVRAAQIRTGAELFGDPSEGKQDPSPYIQALQNGTMTDEQLKAQFQGQPVAAAYIRQAAFQGGKIVPITNQQQATISSLRQLTALVPKMEDLMDTSLIMSPLQKSEKSKEIQTEIAKIAITLGGDKGQRLQKMLIDKAEGFTLGMLTTKSQSVSRIANYQRVIKETFEDVLQSQSPTQKTAMWRTVQGGAAGGSGQAGGQQGQGQPSQPAQPPVATMPTTQPPAPEQSSKRLVSVRKPDGTWTKEWR